MCARRVVPSADQSEGFETSYTPSGDVAFVHYKASCTKPFPHVHAHARAHARHPHVPVLVITKKHLGPRPRLPKAIHGH